MPIVTLSLLLVPLQHPSGNCTAPAQDVRRAAEAQINAGNKTNTFTYPLVFPLLKPGHVWKTKTPLGSQGLERYKGESCLKALAGSQSGEAIAVRGCLHSSDSEIVFHCSSRVFIGFLHGPAWVYFSLQGY